MKFAPFRRHRHARTAVAAGAGLLLGLVAALPVPAWARRNGISAQDCGGCHGGMPEPQVRLEPSLAAVGTGGTVTLTLTINGSASAGFFLYADPEGQFIARSGETTRLMDGGVAHSSPKPSQNGTTTFRVDYKAPAGAAGVQFGVAAVAANNDGQRGGDRSNVTYASVAIGCDKGTLHHRDYDGDGFGRPGIENQMLACSKPEGYATNADDCNDNDETSYPGAPELCNDRDDNCNDMADEGLPIETLYEDGDGDGYGRPGSQMKMGCGPRRGWGVGGTDCNDNDKDVHPNAEEMCNLRDDDCDGRVDDGARFTCGEGWCRRAAPGCDAELCVPGKPRVETCNYFDDDCDGEIDEEPDLCDDGKVCHEGKCVGADTVKQDGPMSMPGGAGGGSVPGPDPDDQEPAGATDPDPRAGGCNVGGDGGFSAPLGLLGLLWLARRRRRAV